MTNEPLLSVRDLRTHFFGDEGITRAVDGVSFDVFPGKTLALVGETGCGKSVTARSILRIVDPPGRVVSGNIDLRVGESVIDLADLPRGGRTIRSIRGGQIGLVFQEPMASFSPVHTVGNQIREAIRLHSAKTSKAQLQQRAVELLELVGVPQPEERLASYPWQLSGGLLQRAMIAMALAGGPGLLILDEPTTALDVITQAHILDLVRDLQVTTGLAMILITHDLGVVAQVADDVAVMYLGRIVEKGPIGDIFERPEHPYTQALLESIPSRASGARQRLATIRGSIPHPFNRPTGCSFHPRCHASIDGVCIETDPAVFVVGDEHHAACHRHDPEVHDIGHGPPPVPKLEQVVGGNGSHARSKTVESETPLLQVRGLTKSFTAEGRRLGKSRGQVHAVMDVNFDLLPGETLALVGESGSGKTTTARCVIRAETPDSGEILFRSSSGDVVDLAKLSRKQIRPHRRDIQMVFQDPFSSLNPRMSVLDIVGEPLLLNGVDRRQDRIERVEELLQLVGLRAEYMHRFPHAFSGGQRQRIGIARALALNPRLVIADEPVSALDVSVQAQTLNLLMDLQAQLGLTYLFVSHDLSVVGHISDRIAVMYAGEIVELGPTAEVLAAPRHPYSAALLAAVPQPDPSSRARFNIPKASPPDPNDEGNGCQFARRCPFVIDRCRTEKPELELLQTGHEVRCHRATELSLLAAQSGGPTGSPSGDSGRRPSFTHLGWPVHSKLPDHDRAR